MLNKLSLTSETLAAVLGQSQDCVKLLDTAGRVLWMNANGQDAMEVDDFSAIEHAHWTSLWPAAEQSKVGAALASAGIDRTSRFMAPCPTAKGSSRYWDVSVSSVHGENGDHSGFLAISRDITAAELDREAVLVLVNEMRHRLKNSYTIVCSLMRGVARGDPAAEQFAEDMAQRVVALAASQSLFDHQQDDVPLARLVEGLLAPFDASLATITVRLTDDILVDRRSADAIAMAVGELAVNSSKHGAVAHGGTIALRGAVEGLQLVLEWRERSNRRVERQTRVGGQGLALIQRIAKARQGELTVDWTDHGPTARVALPLHVPRQVPVAPAVAA